MEAAGRGLKYIPSTTHVSASCVIYAGLRCAHARTARPTPRSNAEEDLQDIWVQEQSGDTPGEIGVGRWKGGVRVEGDLRERGRCERSGGGVRWGGGGTRDEVVSQE